LWFALSATTLGTIDAVEWAPSTASKADNRQTEFVMRSRRILALHREFEPHSRVPQGEDDLFSLIQGGR